MAFEPLGTMDPLNAVPIKIELSAPYPASCCADNHSYRYGHHFGSDCQWPAKVPAKADSPEERL